MFEIKKILNALIYYTNGVVDIDNRGNKFIIENLAIIKTDSSKYHLIINDESSIKGHVITLGNYMGRPVLGEVVKGNTLLTLTPDKHQALLNLLSSIESLGLTEEQWKSFLKLI